MTILLIVLIVCALVGTVLSATTPPKCPLWVAVLLIVITVGLITLPGK